MATVNLAMSRIINALIESVNEKDAILPKYILVVIDKDIINDLPDVDGSNIHKVLSTITTWVVHQLSVVIHRKKVDLLEKKPGALTGLGGTSLIFVKMLRRIGSFHPESRIKAVCSLRPKFNDALNDATAKIDQKILTTNSCNTYEHFDKDGNLSPKGKYEFWMELDDLVARFDRDKIKLHLNQKNPSRSYTGGSSHNYPYHPEISGYDRHQQQCRRGDITARPFNGQCRKLPTPPPEHYRHY